MDSPELTREYDSDISSKHNPLYPIWMAIFRRGDVCPEWHLYSNFEQWVFEQDTEGKELSKIVMQPNNTYFSPELCCYVDRSTISQFKMADRRNVHKLDEKYCVNHRNIYIGIYDTREEAEAVYLDVRINHLRELQCQVDDPKVHRGIENHINYLRSNDETT